MGDDKSCSVARYCALCDPALERLCHSLAPWLRQRIQRAAGAHILSAGDRIMSVRILLSGWALKSRCLADGERQVVGLLLPGDFLPGEVLRSDTALFDVAAKTDCVFGEWSLDEFDRLLRTDLDFTRIFALANALERTVLAERVVSLGRRQALIRAAHLLVELNARLASLGLADRAIPLTQDELADTLGLSKVHTNRVMRALSARGLIRCGRGRIAVADAEGLAELAGSDGAYVGRIRPALPVAAVPKAADDRAWRPAKSA